jgi:hypothetical protein
MPSSTVHRWAKEGMPVRREGRNVVASGEELNQWLQRISGEAAGVHLVTPGSDLLKDSRAFCPLSRKVGRILPQRNPRANGYRVSGKKTLKTKAARKS